MGFDDGAHLTADALQLLVADGANIARDKGLVGDDVGFAGGGAGILLGIVFHGGSAHHYARVISEIRLLQLIVKSGKNARQFVDGSAAHTVVEDTGGVPGVARGLEVPGGRAAASDGG